MEIIIDEILISILMPVKNGAKYLRPALDSIIRQNHEKWELMVIDDFSTDESFQIISQYVKVDNRIKVFHNENKGIVAALNLGFNKCVGDYITRMDADDIMPPNKLYLFISEILKRDGKIVVTGQVEYFSKKSVSTGYRRYQDWLNGLSNLKNSFSEIYRECIIASPNWLVHRACFENDFLLSDLNYPEDYDMVFKWYKSGYKITYIDAITHLWREHEERTSRTSVSYQQESFFFLKTNYFIDLEILPNERVQLIGAGKKGKLVAGILKKRNIYFDWFDFNSSENNSVVLPVSKIKKQYKSILTVWPTSESTQNEIKKYIDDIGLEFGKNVWLF